MFAPIPIAGALLLSLWAAYHVFVAVELAAEQWPGSVARSRATFAAVLVAWGIGVAAGVYARSAVPYWPRDPELVPVEDTAPLVLDRR